MIALMSYDNISQGKTIILNRKIKTNNAWCRPLTDFIFDNDAAVPTTNGRRKGEEDITKGEEDISNSLTTVGKYYFL
jgi:hypothetical protein